MIIPSTSKFVAPQSTNLNEKFYAKYQQTYNRVFEIRRTVGPKGADFRHHTWRSYCLPNIFLLFCCFGKYVPWLLISCLTDCLCNLGSKYNSRICPGFINSKFSKQSSSVTLSLIGGIRGIPLKNLVIADSYEI